MRVGIFTDIHGNLEALDAVAAAYSGERVDRLVCLGDVVGYGANPNECCEIVRRLAGVTVLGNHDAAVCGRMDYSYYYDAAHQVLDWTAGALSPENRAWLGSLEYMAAFDDMCFCHGSPAAPEQFEYIFSLEQARTLLPRFSSLQKVSFVGHSHLCKTFALVENEVNDVIAQKFGLRKGYKYVISAGSIGQPRDYDTRACYTIYDTENRIFEFKRVEYDVDRASAKITAAGLPAAFAKRLHMGI
ncbi:MAG: metallophosphoesterase family protein [Deltaproteobacteria bacterium]|nr:metallophosphoesterase family protein [Deltaproteobacteria bacterium]